MRAVSEKKHLVAVRPAAQRALDAFCAQYNLRPETVLQVSAEYFLNADTLSDKINREGLANDVRRAQRRIRPEKPKTFNRIPGRIVGELDDVASAMLRTQMTEGANTDVLEPGGDPRDIVSASVLFMLDPTDEGITTADWLKQARERRERLEGKEAA